MSTKSFFDGYAADFDSIYGDGVFDRKRNAFEKITDKLFRKAMRMRFDYVGDSIKALTPNSSVLDAGCGGGVYLHFLQNKEQSLNYTGFDFAQNMIDLAKTRAERLRIEDNTSFELADIDSFSSDKKFDLVIGMGFFDYMKNAEEALSKLCSLSADKVIISLPKADHWLALQRKVRYRLRGCDLFLYSTEQRDVLLKKCNHKITDGERDWIVEIKV